jgi:phosphatidate cytidylyltransferase
MKRIATAAVAVPLALAAVFFLPGVWFFLVVLAVMEVGVLEYTRLADRLAPGGPHRVLLVLVPLGALALVPELWMRPGMQTPTGMLWLGFFVIAVLLGCLVLWFRVPVDQGLASLGALAYGLPYLALPVASIYHLQRLDPWVLILLFAIVWLGDTAAFYCGKKWGRRKLAPVVSPNKSWEGAIASLVAAVVAAGAWSYLRLGELRLELLGLAVLISIAAQMGDLLESLIKRGAGVKDSGQLLPGHGGVLDRVDALLFAAPVMLLGFYVFATALLSP